LGEGHAKELVSAGKRLYFVVAVVAFYALAKFVAGYKVQQLSKNGSPDIHRPSPPATLRKYGLSESEISNRKIEFWN
jgi:hypothetical protein